MARERDGYPQLLTTMKHFLCIASCLLFAASLSAADIHCGASATGNGLGGDWDNQADFDTVSLVRGNTYWVADGAYAARTFSTAVSGTTPITVKKATAAAHGSETGWESSFGDGQAVWPSFNITSNYWLIDGVVGQYASDWPGYVQHGIKVTRLMSGASKLIQMGSTSNRVRNITLQHLEIVATNSMNWSKGQDGLYFFGDTDLTFRYLWIHNIGRVCFYHITGSNVLLERSFLEQNGQAQIDMGWDPAVNGISIEHSQILNWGGSDNGNGGVNTIYRYNILRRFRSTGGLTLLPGCNTARIHSSLFLQDEPAVSTGTRIIGGFNNEEPVTNIWIYNNTFYGVTTGGQIGQGAWIDTHIRNNLFYTMRNGTALTFPASGVTLSHNAFFDVGVDFSSQTAAQILTSNPFTDSANNDFTLSVPTQAGYTTDLDATDPNSATRGEDSVWDRGMFEFNAGGGNPGVIQLAATAYNVGESDGSVTISATRVGGSAGTVGVSYATSNGTATAGSDYTSTSGTLSWSDGDSAAKTFAVTIASDAGVEGNETFLATISSATGGASLGPDFTATITIVDDDSAPTVPLMGALTFEADTGLIESPMADGGDYVSQAVTTTDPTLGGRVRWRVTIPDTGDYYMTVSATAAAFVNDTFFLEFDESPTTADIVDLEPIVGDGEQAIVVTHRGSGTSTAPQYNPRVWTLSAGEHTLYLRGREAGAQIHTLTIEAVPEADETAPTPNPATWAQEPYLSGPRTISMSAAVASDVSGPVQYRFIETTGNPGGTSSDWQTSPDYTDSGLVAGTTYTYTVQTRDAVTPTPNTGTASAPASETTEIVRANLRIEGSITISGSITTSAP
jgi:hypothetical protein